MAYVILAGRRIFSLDFSTILACGSPLPLSLGNGEEAPPAANDTRKGATKRADVKAQNRADTRSTPRRLQRHARPASA